MGRLYRRVFSGVVRQPEHSPSCGSKSHALNKTAKAPTQPNPNPQTLNLKPQTPNPKPQTPTFNRVTLCHSLHEVRADLGGDACAPALLHTHWYVNSQVLRRVTIMLHICSEGGVFDLEQVYDHAAVLSDVLQRRE